jgi:predicted HTH domain antitoxin
MLSSRSFPSKTAIGAFVVSLNLHRRHLNESQRSMVGARIARLKRGDNQHSSIELTSQSETAELLNVGVASIKRAKKVLDEGTHLLIEKIEQGKVAVSTAAELIEIDENLIRNEAMVMERGELLKRRKEIYEVKYPETRQGVAGAKSRWNANEDYSFVSTFTEDTATKTGLTTPIILAALSRASPLSCSGNLSGTDLPALLFCVARLRSFAASASCFSISKESEHAFLTWWEVRWSAGLIAALTKQEIE